MIARSYYPRSKAISDYRAVPNCGTAFFVTLFGMVGIVALFLSTKEGVIVFRKNRLYTEMILHAKLTVIIIFM
jgi:hypothetical protein